jgi:septal ring factor EnvC (AmiA/AmiB activator)
MMKVAKNEVSKNEVSNKIGDFYEKAFYGFITVSIGLIIALSVQTYRLGSYRQQLAIARAQSSGYAERQRNIESELSNVRERLEDSNRTLSECRGIISETNARLSSSTALVSDIRKQFKEIRESYEQMESILMGNDISSDNK